MKYTTGAALVALSLAQTVLAHSGFSNFYVNGKNQGDAVCVRMKKDPSKWNSPLTDISGPEMACGVDGTVGVNRVCQVPDGATVTFEWRLSADKPGQGVLDPSHKGPCTVYAKKVDSAISDSAAGNGWFKLWHEGYDEAAGKWCTEKLIASGGLMSINLPKGLAGGAYLLRSEILALHAALTTGPQYYVGCAQIFLESSGNLGPVSTVAIPGIATATDKSGLFDIYPQQMKLPYPIPGPELAKFQASSVTPQTKLTEGLRPDGCIDESGSNWCGFEVPAYVAQADCWKSAEACWAQADKCWKVVPATGIASCSAWQDKCKGIQSDCEAKRAGPANANKDITPAKKDITPPPPLGGTSAAGGSVSTPSQPKAVSATASAAPSVVAKAPVDNYYSSAAAVVSKAAAPVAAASAKPSVVAKAPVNLYSAGAARVSVAAPIPSIVAVGSAIDSTTTTTITRYLTTTVRGAAPSLVADPVVAGSQTCSNDEGSNKDAEEDSDDDDDDEDDDDDDECEDDGDDDDEADADTCDAPAAPVQQPPQASAPAAAVPKASIAPSAAPAPSAAYSPSTPSSAPATPAKSVNEGVDEPSRKEHGHQRNAKPGFDFSNFFEYRKHHFGWWKE